METVIAISDRAANTATAATATTGTTAATATTATTATGAGAVTSWHQMSNHHG